MTFGVARPVSVTCAACGHVAQQWTARCPTCGQAGTMKSGSSSGLLNATPSAPNAVSSSIADAIRARHADRSVLHAIAPSLYPPPTSREVEPEDELASEQPNEQPHNQPIPITLAKTMIQPRISSGLVSLDRVLGEEPDGTAGFIVGSVVLLGGDPGAGKSTLLSQVMANVARAGHVVLYATGEESIEQAARRANRIGALDDKLMIVNETSTSRILAHATRMKPTILAIDSIQTLDGTGIGAAGSLVSVRDGATMLSQFAKATGTIVAIIGQVTKDGKLAGPNSLAHAVDVTMKLEVGEHEASRYRYLRAFKNRFGATNETGAFEMANGGMLDTDEDAARDQDHQAALEASGDVDPVETARLLRAALDYLRGQIDGYDVPFQIADEIAAGASPEDGSAKEDVTS